MVFGTVRELSQLHMSPSMADTIRRLANSVAANEAAKNPLPPIMTMPHYPQLKKYPNFYKSLTEGFKEGEGYTYLTKDTPGLYKSIDSRKNSY